MSDIMCVNCGKEIKGKVEGIMRHPYCKECFWKVWKGDYEAYFKWLKTHHDHQALEKRMLAISLRHLQTQRK